MPKKSRQSVKIKKLKRHLTESKLLLKGIQKEKRKIFNFLRRSGVYGTRIPASLSQHGKYDLLLKEGDVIEDKIIDKIRKIKKQIDDLESQK